MRTNENFILPTILRSFSEKFGCSLNYMKWINENVCFPWTDILGVMILIFLTLIWSGLTTILLLICNDIYGINDNLLFLALIWWEKIHLFFLISCIWCGLMALLIFKYTFLKVINHNFFVHYTVMLGTNYNLVAPYTYTLSCNAVIGFSLH